MIANFTWPKPSDDSDTKLLVDVVEHKCHVVAIPAGTHGPLYAFSIGLFLHFEHPELLIFGVSPKTAAVAINDICKLIESGRRFHHGDVSDEVFNGFRVAFAEVPPSCYSYYLGTGLWFYRSLPKGFPTLQIVWPDKQRKFPWEPGHDPVARERQPVLAESEKVIKIRASL